MTRKATGLALVLLVLAWCVIAAPQLYVYPLGFWALIEVMVSGLWVFWVPSLAYVAVWFLAERKAEKGDRTVSLALGVGAFSGAWITIAGLLALEVFRRVTMGHMNDLPAMTWSSAPFFAAFIAVFGAIIGFFTGLLLKALRG
jgi:hypothetical protein